MSHEFPDNVVKSDFKKQIQTPEATKYAARLAIEHGQSFAKQHPEIAEIAVTVYEDSGLLTATKIAEKYKVRESYGVSQKVAGNIVREALKLLLSPEQLIQREAALIKQARERDRLQKTGFFGYSPEKRRAISAKAGKASKGVTGNRQRSGFAARDQKAGVHRLDRGELQAASHKGYLARKDTWFAGEIINDMNEGEYLLSLAKQEEYKHQGGQYAGLPDTKKLTAAVNAIYNKNRNVDNVRAFLRRYYKKS